MYLAEENDPVPQILIPHTFGPGEILMLRTDVLIYWKKGTKMIYMQSLPYDFSNKNSWKLGFTTDDYIISVRCNFTSSMISHFCV